MSSFAETAADERKRPVRARHAASVVLWRRAGTGLEVLMGMRGAGHRFMPNRLVFPGGAVDAADGRAPFATPLRPDVRALLERRTRPHLAQALAIAAVRELEEETGLHLGHPPALHMLDFLCRAVTPTQMPIRFNARFLVAPAEVIDGTLGGSGELEALRFYDVEEALGYDLIIAQRVVLDQLRHFVAMSDAERSARRQTLLLHNRRPRME